MVFEQLEALEGWREYRVRGAMPAAFLNRWARTGLPLLGAESEDDCTLLVRLRARDGARAERLALRCQCTAEQVDAGGAPTLARGASRRWVMVLGLALAFLLLAWSRCYIWEIEIRGNERLSTGRIRSALAECGVDLGCFWPGITADLLRSRLLEELPELRWATVNVYGSRAEVLVRERIPKPEIWKADEPVELRADKTGFVTRLQVLNGTALIRPGSAVAPGETLIAGWTDSSYGGRRWLHATGTVEAETWYELTAETPLSRTVKQPVGRPRSRWALILGKNRLNFYRNSSISGADCDMISETKSLSAEGLFALPISLVRETRTPVARSEQKLDEGEARRAMEAELRQRLLAAIGPEGAVLEEHYSCTEREGCLSVCLRARCRELIGVEAPAREAEGELKES